MDFSKEGEKIQPINLGNNQPNIIDLKMQLKSKQIMALNQNVTSFFNDQYGNHGGNGFCQRERNESFSTCYKAEKDEFCDNFFSCLAADTQPGVMILLAAACSCSANQSD